MPMLKEPIAAECFIFGISEKCTIYAEEFSFIVDIYRNFTRDDLIRLTKNGYQINELFGVSIQNRGLLLLDLTFKSLSTQGSSTTTKFYFKSLIIFKNHCTSNLFSSIEIETSDYTKWYLGKLIDFDSVFAPVKITVSEPITITIPTSFGEFSVSTKSEFQLPKRKNSFEYKFISTFKMKLNEIHNQNESIRLLTAIRIILTFFLNQNLEIRKINLLTQDQIEAELLSYTEFQNNNIHESDIVRLKFDILNQKSHSILNDWLKIANNNHLFVNYLDSFLHDKHNDDVKLFLLAMQFMETASRIIIPSTNESNEYKDFINNLMSFADKNFLDKNKNLKNRLDNHAESSTHKSTRKVIEELINYAGTSFSEVKLSKSSITVLVETRNYYTHPDSSQQKCIMPLESLYGVSWALYYIVKISILKYINVNTQELKEYAEYCSKLMSVNGLEIVKRTNN